MKHNKISKELFRACQQKQYNICESIINEKFDHLVYNDIFSLFDVDPKKHVFRFKNKKLINITMISFKTYLQRSQALTEASVLDPKYTVGQKFLVSSTPAFAKELEKGDIVTVVPNKKGPPDYGSGEYEKTLELPSGRTIKVASDNPKYASGNFNRMRDSKILPKGEDWESLIVVAYNNKFEGPEWERAEKFWGEYGEQAKKIAEEFKQVLRSRNIQQLGSDRARLNPEWGGTNNTPKTDVIGGPNERISLKKAGGSQLLSAGRKEAVATFQAAVQMVGENRPELFTTFIDSLEEKMGRLKATGTITELERLRKSGKELTPQQKANIAEMDKLQLNAREINNDMNKIFEHNYFKTAFCFEAATGTTKFLDKNAVANLLIEFDPSKSLITKHMGINKIEDAGPLARNNKLVVSFKTSGSSPALALRSRGLTKREMAAMTNEETFSDIVKQELSKSEFGNQLLSEAAQERLDEFKLFDNLVSRVRGVSDAARNAAKKIYDTIMERVKKAFDFIKRLGKKMFTALLNFLGMTVESVSITSTGSFPLVKS
jgi:hypothetical protein